MIRGAKPSDANALLELMRQLAVFEGYAERFAVTADELVARGLGSEREFSAWVAERRRILIGYCVAYMVPFTFDLRPTVVLKELFVAADLRSAGVGQELFAAVIRFARSKGARLVRWQVLPGNESARKFYRRRGGVSDVRWESWLLDLDAV